MTVIKPNANFYSLGGNALHDVQSDEYKEYRRCWLENPKNFILRDFPLHLDIEITSRCNLRCIFCDKLPVLIEDRLGDMDFELYKKIIDEGVGHNLWAVKLSYRGEPLLHKDVVRMVEYTKKKGILDVYFNTNGMLLSEEISRKLIEVGLDRISISIDGTNPLNFEKQRVGAKFNVILSNILHLLELRKKLGVSHPKIRIQTVYFPEVDLNAYRSFWQPFCDEVAAVDFKEGLERKRGIIFDWGCPQLWQRMTIEWDGTVHPCNNDDSSFSPLGNVNQKSIYELWHDKRLIHLRFLHQKGESHRVELCDGCPWRTTQIKKIMDSLPA